MGEALNQKDFTWYLGLQCPYRTGYWKEGKRNCTCEELRRVDKKRRGRGIRKCYLVFLVSVK
jgi:hypothetical protein